MLSIFSTPLAPKIRIGRERFLSPLEEQEVDPRQYDFDFGLWTVGTRQIVANLIFDRFDIELSLSGVGKLNHPRQSRRIVEVKNSRTRFSLNILIMSGMMLDSTSQLNKGGSIFKEHERSKCSQTCER